MMGTLLEAEGLRKRFGATQALDGVDLTVPQGAIIGLLGPNGAGKTTMLRILSTLTLPDAGPRDHRGVRPGPRRGAGPRRPSGWRASPRPWTRSSRAMRTC